jgi:Protein of unknown function (DUF3558)
MSLAAAVCVVTGSIAVAACSDDSGETEGASASASDSATATGAVTSSDPVGGATTAAPVDPVTVNAVDPCALLTVDEISAALLAPVLEPVAGPQANLPNPLGQRTCTWSTQESPPRSLSISAVTTESAQAGGALGGSYSADQLFEDTKQLVEGLEPVADVGDDAYLGSVAGVQMSVLDGDVYISVGVPFGSSEAEVAAVRALAPVAVSRLP